ncbi:MAG: nuclear transport factor 2 family protein [Halioglobus sp.]|nr:nuclear transport factor 2 family protein [Halioglobus sp.]
MLSQQELSDRFEIQDLVFQYAHLIDSKNFDALRDVFSEDAHVDYGVYGGSVGDLETTIDYLKSALASGVFPNTQHLNANVQISVDGDSATGRVMCFNPMDMSLPDGGRQTFMLGLWYVDSYRRTKDGWRISQRREEKSWVFNAPDFMDI